LSDTRPPATDSGHFRSVLGNFPTGVTVVTAIDDGKPVGMAIGSFTSVSLDPPLVAFLPTKDSSTWAAIERSGSFCVNILADDQKDECGVFASKAEDKFAAIDWSPTEDTGSPRLSGALAWIDCETEAVHDGGDHVIVVGRVKALEACRDCAPLLFFQGKYGTFQGIS